MRRREMKEAVGIWETANRIYVATHSNSMGGGDHTQRYRYKQNDIKQERIDSRRN